MQTINRYEHLFQTSVDSISVLLSKKHWSSNLSNSLGLPTTPGAGLHSLPTSTVWRLNHWKRFCPFGALAYFQGYIKLCFVFSCKHEKNRGKFQLSFLNWYDWYVYLQDQTNQWFFSLCGPIVGGFLLKTLNVYGEMKVPTPKVWIVRYLSKGGTGRNPWETSIRWNQSTWISENKSTRPTWLLFLCVFLVAG